MSVIRPFRGLRPRPEQVAQVAAPPYDVLSSDEARELVRNNPISFLRINKPEVDFDPDTPVHSQKVYDRGKANLQRLVEDGILCRDDQPSLYLYRLTWQGLSQTGLAALTSTEEYNQGKIKKHEHTRPEKVIDRAAHIRHVNAQVGPVLSIFRRNDRIKQLFAAITGDKPVYDFVDDGQVRHELWVVSNDQMIADMVAAFAGLDALYIADGHHRSAAAAEVARLMKEENPSHDGTEPYNFFLNVIFPDDELRILPYNRVVKGLSDKSFDQVLDEFKESFAVKPQESSVEPRQGYHFGAFCRGKWYELTAREGSFNADHPAESIDAAVLTANLLKPTLGIENVRTDKRIDFVGGIRGVGELERLVNSGDFDIAFSLYPVTVGQLLAVADAGEVMPPKSTWFEPKLRSGMVINLLDK
jgi:uncharacterized protein (DUF1015 family)